MEDFSDDYKKEIEKIRVFNRMYAKKVGVLNSDVFGSAYSLTEVRVIHEIGVRESATATELSRALDLDCGYLSRILNRFAKDELVNKERSIQDARQHKLSLTQKGAQVWAGISDNANKSIDVFLRPLSTAERQELIAAMNVIARLLDKTSPA